MESMSNAPYLLPGARFGLRLGDATARDAVLADGLESPWSGKHMAAEATEVAAELEITRAEMDRWAVRSAARAVAALDGVTPVNVYFDVLSDTEKAALQQKLVRGSLPAGSGPLVCAPCCPHYPGPAAGLSTGSCGAFHAPAHPVSDPATASRLAGGTGGKTAWADRRRGRAVPGVL